MLESDDPVVPAVNAAIVQRFLPRSASQLHPGERLEVCSPPLPGSGR
ncbi:hypothetical protein [Candidatus Mycolicibacterium alkanivorans]|uniref:Uncharacterized protein n=1 Tax=Candidatus Mycolicibacterium alkanivorans TaxID=2954114 RepID=A0ABS9YWX2_9MYCO|nr:hypothetical protein [Candidatus Mycolicibacterium alkanivorans]MCI4675718.1 hypothetical protein [Candidatus Mycolicibacterium alkanivorans]